MAGTVAQQQFREYGGADGGTAAQVDDLAVTVPQRPLGSGQVLRSHARTLPARRNPYRHPAAASRAARMSATTSTVSSIPQDSRTSPSGTGSPHCARRSADVCVPPNDVAAAT